MTVLGGRDMSGISTRRRNSSPPSYVRWRTRYNWIRELASWPMEDGRAEFLRCFGLAAQDVFEEVETLRRPAS